MGNKMKYLWTEDTGAGLYFWQLANELFFGGKLEVESKGSNQGILDAVSHIDTNDNNIYYIAFDWLIIRIFGINTDYSEHMLPNRITIL